MSYTHRHLALLHLIKLHLFHAVVREKGLKPILDSSPKTVNSVVFYFSADLLKAQRIE